MDDPIANPESTDGQDPVDSFLLECLDAGPGERRDHLVDLRRKHPEHGKRVDQLLRLLDDFGFLDEAAEHAQGLPERIGDFRVLRLLGTGGMGTVYLAEQTSLGRHVALKVIHQHLVRSARARERFRREALAASRLDHPAICTVYEVGEAEDLPFLAMRLVPGRTLDEHIANAAETGAPPVRLPRREGESGVDAVLRHVETLARALHAAHTEGFVHRDVKPGNVMVRPDGEPVLLDFGLAVVDSDDGHRLTLSGDHVGTPLYMAPEQVQSQPADPRTDVYALGVLLYECLTLKPPFTAVSRESLFQQILREEPADPRRGNPAIGRDLAVVLQTAMAKEPDRRYATAAALAEDLRAVRRREPIQARPAGALLRLRRFAQRHPAAAVALVALAVGLLVVAGLLQQVRQALGTSEDLRLASEARQRASTNPREALPSLIAVYEQTPDPTTRGALYAALASAHEVRRLAGHRGVVWRTVSSRDGGFLASCADDATARIWDAATGEAVAILQHDRQVVDVDTDGERVVTASLDGTVRLWRFDGAHLADAPLPERSGLAEECFRARFSHDGTRIAITNFVGQVWLWDLQQDSIRELVGHTSQVWTCSFSPDDRLLVTAAGTNRQGEEGDCTARIWRLDGDAVVPLEGHAAPLFAAEFSPDGRHVLTGSRDATVRLWTSTGELVRPFAGFTDAVRCLRFHPDGTRFAAGDLDGNVRVYGCDGTLHASFALDGGVRHVEFSRDGNELVAAGSDKAVRLYDTNGRLLHTLHGHADHVTHATFLPDGERIATASFDHSVRLWWRNNPEFRVEAAATVAGIRSLAFARDGAGLVAGSEDGMVFACGPNGTAPLETAADATGAAVNEVAIGPSGGTIAAAHDDHTYTVWRGAGVAPTTLRWRQPLFHMNRPVWRNPRLAFLDEDRFLAGAQNGEVAVFGPAGERRRISFPQIIGELEGLCVHPDGAHFATGHWSGRVLVRSLAGEVVLLSDPLHDRFVVDLEFSPSGDYLVTASADNTARLWRWTGAALEPVCTLAHDAAVTSASFSPDGERILTTARDGTARLWQVPTGQDFLTIQTGPRALFCGAWSPDGSTVVTGSDHGLVQWWPVDMGRVLELARRRAGR